MRIRLWVIACVAVLALHGCGSGSNGSSGDPNHQRCQATCTSFCATPRTCSPCVVDDCVNLCLGTTAGLTAVCAECVILNPTYEESPGVACMAIFKSTASADCLPVCAGTSGDAGMD